MSLSTFIFIYWIDKKIIRIWGIMMYKKFEYTNKLFINYISTTRYNNYNIHTVYNNNVYTQKCDEITNVVS